jgi:hypothetical protein
MPGKTARSAPQPAFGVPEVLVAVHTSRLSCRKAGKAQIFAPVWESSGESRLIGACLGKVDRFSVEGVLQRAPNAEVHWGPGGSLALFKNPFKAAYADT